MEMIPNSYTTGQTDRRPWGTWKVLDVMPHVVVKKLVIDPGRRISLQRHRFRSERWIVVDGVACVQKDGEVIHLNPGEGVFLPQGCMHRLANDSSEPATIIEIQFGELLSEDDIERFNDDYGRVEQ